MARSIIHLTTPMSATASMFRVIKAIGRGRYRPLGWVSDHYAAGRMDLVASGLPPPQDHLIHHNAPERFNPATPLRDYRFILNARDPRDLLCNQYHWQFVHPFPGETAEAEAARRQRIAAMGMDAWVLAQDFHPVLHGFFAVARRIAPPDRIFIGYAMYCLHFDEVAQRIAAFLNVPLDTLPEGQWAAIGRERVANLPENPAWIGQQWAGADTAPGRHRRELQPETIAALTTRYRWFLDFLRRMDDPRVAPTYD